MTYIYDILAEKITDVAKLSDFKSNFSPITHHISPSVGYKWLIKIFCTMQTNFTRFFFQNRCTFSLIECSAIVKTDGQFGGQSINTVPR